jgi:hypothetical protein
MSDLFVEIIFRRCPVKPLISKEDSKERLVKFTFSEWGRVGRGYKKI